MKSIAADDAIRNDPQLRETECALAISPVPRIDWPNEAGMQAQLAPTAGAGRRPGAAQTRRKTDCDDALTDTLSIGWAIAIAIAVALTVYTSGA
jgi:hypothetical protein